MIVIDIGCADYGQYNSIAQLIEEFKLGDGSQVFGFDPHPSTIDILYLNQGKLDPKTFDLLPPEGPNIRIQRMAAWTYDGEIGFHEEKLGSYVSEKLETKVPCFDLAAFIRSLPSDEEIVLKIDAEGAEYPLLEHLIATRTDELLKFAWVEFHGSSNEAESAARAMRKRAITAEISCELAEWTL